MLIQSIEALWRAAEALQRPVVASRAPGVPVEEVEAVLGRAVPGDVATWFGWSNGVAYAPGQVQDDAALVPGYEPLSVREAAAVRDGYGSDDPVLGDFYVPLLATGGGDFYAVVCERSPEHPPVAHVMIGGETDIVYPSVGAMVEAFCRFYRNGVFFVSDEGTLEADDVRWVAQESGARPSG
ncbi:MULTISPECIES: hypothetical protein [unclassified Streptomyces]|uniref:hypothetical protein n=1 Tax=unclassified Streptomyces TaxID=2593676 RepID=UPI0036FCC35E